MGRNVHLLQELQDCTGGPHQLSYMTWCMNQNLWLIDQQDLWQVFTRHQRWHNCSWFVCIKWYSLSKCKRRLSELAFWSSHALLKCVIEWMKLVVTFNLQASWSRTSRGTWGSIFNLRLNFDAEIWDVTLSEYCAPVEEYSSVPKHLIE